LAGLSVRVVGEDSSGLRRELGRKRGVGEIFSFEAFEAVGADAACFFRKDWGFLRRSLAVLDTGEVCSFAFTAMEKGTGPVRGVKG
jgi:hypothetical protein